MYLAFHFSNDHTFCPSHYNEYASYSKSLLIVMKYSTTLTFKFSTGFNMRSEEDL